MGRRILAAVAGLVAGTVAIMLVETLGHRLYPMPADLDPKDPAALGRWMAGMPVWAWLVVLAAYAAGSVVGGAVARRLAPGRPLGPALWVGIVLTLLGFVNLATLPGQPLWFAIASTLCYVPCAWLGARLVRPAA
jgi:hypothetical protein